MAPHYNAEITEGNVASTTRRDASAKTTDLGSLDSRSRDLEVARTGIYRVDLKNGERERRVEI
jgi:hypothetical protein